MHLPDGIIPLEQEIIYYIISLIILTLYFHKFSKNDNKEKQIVLIAIFAVFTFVLSSLSVPSPLGVPIHFFLIPLVVILLGYVTGTIVAFISLLGQVLFLNMGGITSFGANFIVMGFIIALVTHVFYSIFEDINEKLAILVSTVMGIICATLGQILILLWTGTIGLELLLSTLIPYYFIISIIEAIANIIIISSVKEVKPEIMDIEKI